MDLADQIDDYICSFEGLGDLTMDSLAIFIFIWGVVSLFLVWLCKFLYNKYMLKEKAPSQASSRQGSVAKSEKRLSEPRDILATKTDVKDLLAKPATARGRSGSGSGAGAAIGGGVRRRIVRQSSTGPENRKKRYVPPPSNVVGPETTSVTWTSQVFRWLYSDLVIVNELLMTWVIALNESLKSSLEKHGIAVEIVRVLPDSPPPALSNIFCNCDENNPADMLITYDCDAMPVLQVKTFRQKAGKVETSHYKVTVSRLRARLAAAMNYNTLKGDMRIEGYPDVRIAMNSVGAIKPMDQDEQQLQELISEILSAAIRDTVYPMDFSMYSTCPRGELDPLEMPHNMEQHHSNSQGAQSMVSGRRLLVKIVKGEGLQKAVDPFVVVEMDEPAQKNQTRTRPGSNPYWDEHFLFELSPSSAEILFEVYDRPSNNSEDPKFLGLGLVGIDELAVGPACTQKMTLQPRPYENQHPVQGSIIVDFVFIEGAEIPADTQPHKMKEALRLSSLAINEHIKNGSDLADAAVRALQEGTFSSNGQPSKSTLIIHSVQRVEMNKDGKIEMTEAAEEPKDEGSVTPTPTTTKSLVITEADDMEAKIQETSLTTDITASPTDSYPNEDSLMNSGNSSSMLETEFGQPNAASSPNGHNNYTFNGASNNNGYNGSSTLNSTNNNNNTYSSSGYQTGSLPRNGTAATNSIDAELDDRGRSKKRNFFGTLRKRLGRSKTRTLSADAQNKDGTNNTTTPNSSATKGTLNGDSRSLSVDRAVMSRNKSFGARSPGLVNHSRRSSISESSAISGFSSASTKTYIHEASTLVLETIENGIKRHFIVPLAIAQRPKWRRKGTKLHIYNDHTFIAKHLSGGGLQCSVCMKSIPRRPGKQGYECRDCQLICHKQCHVRAPQACPNPTVLSMELNTFPVLTEADLH